MISKEDFVRQVTELNQYDKLCTMTIKQILSIREAKSHNLCIWIPGDTVFAHQLCSHLNNAAAIGANMLVYQRSQSLSTFYSHSLGVDWLEGSSIWRGYDYFVIPIEEATINIEELI